MSVSGELNLGSNSALNGPTELESTVFSGQVNPLMLDDNVVASARGGKDEGYILGYSAIHLGNIHSKNVFIIKYNTSTRSLAWKKVLGNIGEPRALCVSHDEATGKTSAFIGKILHAYFCIPRRV